LASAVLLLVLFAPPFVGAGALVYLRVVGHVWVLRRQPQDAELDLDAQVADLLEDGGTARAGVTHRLELGLGYLLPYSDPAFGGGVGLGGEVGCGLGRFRLIGALRPRLLPLPLDRRTRLPTVTQDREGYHH